MAPRTKEDNLRIQEQTRQKIVMAALQAFGEKGYASTTVSQIAKEAGISKGLIYHYYNSKEEVLKGIFDMMVDEGEGMMADWEGKGSEEKLRQTIAFSINFMKQQTNVMRFMMSLALQPAAIADLEEVMSEQRENMMRSYQQVFSGLGYEDAEAEGYYMGAVLDGAALGLMTVPEYPIDKIEKMILKRYNL